MRETDLTSHILPSPKETRIPKPGLLTLGPKCLMQCAVTSSRSGLIDNDDDSTVWGLEEEMQFRVNDKLNYEHILKKPAETPCGKGHTYDSWTKSGSRTKDSN